MQLCSEMLLFAVLVLILVYTLCLYGLGRECRGGVRPAKLGIIVHERRGLSHPLHPYALFPGFPRVHYDTRWTRRQRSALAIACHGLRWL